MSAPLRALVLAAVCLGAPTACIAPPPPAQRVADAARELNLGARFGRMDVAMGRTAPGARKHFAERRQQWGGEVRVLDVELAGLDMPDHDNATVIVDTLWVRQSEGSLRHTRIEQRWKNEVEGGWRLVRERRLDGDLGLFGERVTVLHPEPRGDVHFATRVIR